MARDEIDDRGPADEALAASARAGNREAFAELWRRHARAGAVAARQFAHIADTDDLLSEAYLRIFAALGRDGGPRGAFRPYLYRTIRNVALDWRRSAPVPLDDVPEADLALPGPELAAAERTIGFRAFRSLPERWQSVLWYLDVEGLDPAEAAPMLGLSPNATSALAARAREGLKKAWLQAHVNEGPVPEGCRWTTARMGEFSRGRLARRSRERFRHHLASCDRCTALLEEVEDAGGRLAVLLLPLFLGGSAAAAILAERATDAGPRPSSAPPMAPGVLVVAGGAAAAVAVGVALAFALSSVESPRHPTSASPPAVVPTGEPVLPTSPSPEPTPEAPPAAPPRVPAPPPAIPPPPVVAPPPVVDPPPVAPAAPVAPTVDFDPATGLLAATGSGDSPGATIELWGTTTSIVTGLTSPETLLATTVVAPDGTWVTPAASGLTPINVTAFVTQVRDGLSSDPVELFADAIFNVVAVSTDATVAGGTATWDLTGWPGAAWEIREPAGGPTVASGTFAPDGTALAAVVLPAVPGGTILAFDYGYVLDGGMAASTPGLTATAP